MTFYQPRHKSKNDIGLLKAIQAMANDKQFEDLGTAVKEKNTKEMTRLIPILRQRYGEKDFVVMYRALNP